MKRSMVGQREMIRLRTKTVKIKVGEANGHRCFAQRSF